MKLTMSHNGDYAQLADILKEVYLVWYKNRKTSRYRRSEYEHLERCVRNADFLSTHLSFYYKSSLVGGGV